MMKKLKDFPVIATFALLGKGKVKSAYEPSDPSSWSLSWFL